MPIEYKPLASKSLSRQIADNIYGAIMEGSLKVDERLPTEDELAQSYSVSRPTIREALKLLAAQNLVRSRRGPTGGTFVNKPNSDQLQADLTSAATLMVGMGEFDLSQMNEARHQLEVVCVRMAAQRCPEECLQVMEAELEVQADPNITDEEFCASDVRFHRALVDGTGNPVLQFLMTAVIEALQPVANLIAYRFRDKGTILAQHQRIFDAIKQGDESEAVAAMDEQMRYMQEQHQNARQWREKKQEN
ncbi:MAG: FadR family transcriptional regulator [Motiliproteus sp.]|nr:FadR family transcriptional regulator [Motiliproteus sp.]MCW9053929.1 FadR family transcriptional regulator [Motiliproteus sp.]